MKKGKAIERCKTAIIVLLLCSVVLLSLAAIGFSGSDDVPLLSDLRRILAGEQVLPPKKAQEPTFTDAAMPVVISVSSQAGRTTFHQDFDALDAAFEFLGSHLAAALDTARDVREITAAEFTEAATGSSILFRYPGSISLPVLAAWLDADASDLGLSGDVFLLAAEETEVALLVCGDGSYWRLTTDADLASFRDALDDNPADGTLLALESEAYARLDPLTLIDPTDNTIPAASAANPCDDTFLTHTATVLGFNPYGDTSYQDESGTVYSETDCTLRISADGVLTLRNQGLAARFSAQSDSDGDRIEYIRSLLDAVAGDVLGDARLYFTGLEHSEDTTTILFSTYLSGLSVEHADGPAVQAVFQGTILTELTFRIRNYTLSQSETITLMPAAQAAAIAQYGTLLVPAYADRGDPELTAGWLR